MKHLLVLSVLLSVTFWIGCRGTTTEWVPNSAFSYTSYDSSGVAVVTGWFTMDLSDSAAVSGEWHFWPIGNPEGIGPQTGSGRLVGGFSESELWVELNPQYVDNNLTLRGTLQGDRYTGDWLWISFVGITNQGTFEAQRR